VEDYEVHEKVRDVGAIAEAMPRDPRDADRRDDSLRIVSESMEVHRVKRVEFATDKFTVKRHRREKSLRDGTPGIAHLGTVL
jgi:hypothetical protein